MLSQKLEAADCHVLQAVGDDDVLIANTAVASAAESTTTVIGEDTDVLVLLITGITVTPVLSKLFESVLLSIYGKALQSDHLQLTLIQNLTHSTCSLTRRGARSSESGTSTGFRDL